VDPNSIEGNAEQSDIEAAGRALERQIVIVRAAAESEFHRAFAKVAERNAGGLLVDSGPLLTSNRRQLVALATYHRIVAVYSAREFVDAGGLISYASSFTAAYRKAAATAARILRGEKPAELPVQLPTKFELVINLATAKALGIHAAR
jgi:putative ABC transport system substrate-binding protein